MREDFGYEDVLVLIDGDATRPDEPAAELGDAGSSDTSGWNHLHRVTMELGNEDVTRRIDRDTARMGESAAEPGGVAANLDVLYELFLPEAIIIKNIEAAPLVYDVDGFVEPRRQLVSVRAHVSGLEDRLGRMGR